MHVADRNLRQFESVLSIESAVDSRLIDCINPCYQSIDKNITDSIASPEIMLLTGRKKAQYSKRTWP
jgi:hypothetical protein